MPEVPNNYIRLANSERHPVEGSTLIGPANENELIKVTITVRRRPDGQEMPDADFFKTPPSQRQRMSDDEFAKKYGASEADLAKVTEFAHENQLNIIETSAARRSVVVSGTVAQMNKAFSVQLGKYEHKVSNIKGQESQVTSYRGRDGFIYAPKSLEGIVEGVFGLDNRNVTKRNRADPANIGTLETQAIIRLYNFPTNSAAGQTIGIISEDGYQSSDINATFKGNPPNIIDVQVNQTNSGNADGETTQDISIAGIAAPGANIAVYFHDGSQAGWVESIKRIAHPKAGDPVCSVISSSFYISDGDDQTALLHAGVSNAFIDQLSEAFRDATLQGVTICVASGDTGSMSKIRDGKAHVQYPASDPWVLSVGGTTIGNVNGNTFDEYVWNDPDPNSSDSWGTTGGGISDYFALPFYQNRAVVPPSVNDNHAGRGVPDVSANASYKSGYADMIVAGQPSVGNGTSASSPLWAGLIAVINAALGGNIGFVNPAIYSLGSSVFRDILPGEGPADNSNAGVAGYPAKAGWDACTGWGSINGKSLLEGLRRFYKTG